MALFTTNPQETVTVVETVASRIPTAELIDPLDAAEDVAPNPDITLSFGQGQLTLPVVSVNGVVIFRDNQPQRGWTAKSRTALGETLLLVLSPPSGFAYGSTVTVNVEFEPEAGNADDDGIIILS